MMGVNLNQRPKAYWLLVIHGRWIAGGMRIGLFLVASLSACEGDNITQVQEYEALFGVVIRGSFDVEGRSHEHSG